MPLGDSIFSQKRGTWSSNNIMSVKLGWLSQILVTGLQPNLHMVVRTRGHAVAFCDSETTKLSMITSKLDFTSETCNIIIVIM